MILESAQGPNPFFYSTFIQLRSLLGPGFGPGLDNYSDKYECNEAKIMKISSENFCLCWMLFWTGVKDAEHKRILFNNFPFCQNIRPCHRA